MTEINLEQAAKLVEAGDGCPALDNYLIGRSTTKEEWRNLLQAVVDANAQHRLKDSHTPELIIVEKPDEISGTRIGLTRKDLEEAGGLSGLVDRTYGVGNDPDISHSYDCRNLEERYRHGNLPKLK